MDIIEEYHNEDDYAIISIGGVGSDFFKARGMNVSFELRGFEDHPSFEQVGQIISQSVEMYKSELFDELYVCYNHYVNSLTSQVRVQQMLPIGDLDVEESKAPASANFELEPNRSYFRTTLASIYRKYDLRGYR